MMNRSINHTGESRRGSWLWIAFFLSGLILSTGCAGRSIHSGGEGQVERHGGALSHAPSLRPSLDEANGRDAFVVGSPADPADEDADHRRTEGPTTVDALDAETIGEESSIADFSAQQAGRDYWEARRRAELAAAQYGVNDIHFEFDSWRLTKDAKRILAVNAQWLKAHPNARVTIEGHCDERGTRAYNYILGEKRATIARNYLAALGVPPRQMVIQSYGKDNPVCRQDDESCYAKNRRAHFLLGFTMAATTRR